jgi:hypothetical protein
MLRKWKGYGFMADGVIRIPSSFGLKQTIDRLETEVMAKGLTIFARIDHAAGAAQVGLPVESDHDSRRSQRSSFEADSCAESKLTARIEASDRL